MSGPRMENGASVFLRIAQRTQISQLEAPCKMLMGLAIFHSFYILPAFVIDVKESEYK